MHPELRIRPGDSQDGVVELTVEGVLDTSTAATLREELAAQFDQGVRRLALDLSDLTFLDSAGLGVLVAAFKRYQCGGGRLELRRPSRHVQRVLDVTGVGQVFGVPEGAREPKS